LLLVLDPARAARGQEPAAPPAGTPASPEELAALLDRFARMQGLKARFREERRLALLEAPLVDEGTLHFAPPGRLARHVERPARSTVLIEADRLRLWDGKETRELPLEKSPVARELVAGFLLILAGDEAGLRRLYELELTRLPGDDRWRLVLRPRGKPLSEAIARLEFVGRGLVVERLLMVETGGDETETTFSEVDPAHVYSPEEAARVFALPDPAPRRE
jgi:hypothetical protein